MNKENCGLKLVDEIILYYDARSKKHQITDGEYLKNVFCMFMHIYSSLLLFIARQTFSCKAQ